MSHIPPADDFSNQLPMTRNIVFVRRTTAHASSLRYCTERSLMGGNSPVLRTVCNSRSICTEPSLTPVGKTAGQKF